MARAPRMPGWRPPPAPPPLPEVDPDLLPYREREEKPPWWMFIAAAAVGLAISIYVNIQRVRIEQRVFAPACCCCRCAP